MHAKHLAIENKCGIGERGQTPKNVTGLENEVGTPRHLQFVPNNFRGYIYIYKYTYIYNISHSSTMVSGEVLLLVPINAHKLNSCWFQPTPSVFHGDRSTKLSRRTTSPLAPRCRIVRPGTMRCSAASGTPLPKGWGETTQKWGLGMSFVISTFRIHGYSLHLACLLHRSGMWEAWGSPE